MKKVFKVFVSLLLVFSLFACQNKEITFSPGTYTGVGAGNFGEITVTMEFSDKEILSIVIGDNIETPDIVKPVFENIPEQILSTQSLKVDIVTGATNSSNGLIEAIEDCIEQADGDVNALRNRKIVVTQRDPIELTTDVVVIGGGGAGITAAAAAVENGASVILLEKSSALGGNTLRAGGAYNAVDPARQSAVAMTPALTAELKEILNVNEKDCGEFEETVRILKGQINDYFAKGDTTKLFDSVELHMYHIYVGGSRADKDGNEIVSNATLARVLAENSLPALEWLAGHDETIEITPGISTVLGAMWPRTHSLNVPVGTGYVTPLATYAQNNGAEFILDTKVESLIIEDGKVVGVKGVQSDGTPITVHAKNVIMATGGFAANAPMVAEYNNYWDYIPNDMKSTNTNNATGDGITIAKESGANLVGMEFSQLMPSSHPDSGALSGGVWGSAEDQVFVNLDGKRFVNEYAERDVLSNAALNQKDALFFIISDDVILGSPKSGDKNGWGDDIDTLIETGGIYKADTLEDLAKQMGVDPATFVAEIEKYNSFIDSQNDLDFHKGNLGAKILVAPFYATPRSPSLHHTMGGLEINEFTQVLDINGNVIEGLYAAGEITGGIHAGNRLGGNALADIVVFGRIAGEQAAKNR